MSEPSAQERDDILEVMPEAVQPAPRHVQIRMPTRHNTVLRDVIERVNGDEELYALWTAINVNAMDRLGMSDHGPVHVQIVANIALKLLRLLEARQITPNIVGDHNLTTDDAEVVVVLGALLHDLGMSIHRLDHEEMSLFVARPIISRLLDGLYPIGARTIMLSEISHAIISHRSNGRPLTVEAGVVRVADALDMTKGRTRIPFEKGMINIHSVSAAAIEKVEIGASPEKPIHIKITMSNSAGVFQLDELLKEKLHGSGLEPYVSVEASIEGEAEKKLLTVFRL
jgi:metal-dependent HD superfamily phosphatase/phosphodiesterase